VVVVGEGQVLEMLPFVVVVIVETFHVMVVVVMVKVMIHIRIWILGLSFNPGRTQGYV